MSRDQKIPLRLGTRASMLAQTQAKMVQHHLQEHFPNLDVSLVLIQTKGDLQQQQPLWQMEGENFFTKELDEALKRGEVDAVIHSGKDLSTKRPPGFHLAAFPKRDLPHDMLLIPKQRWHELTLAKTLVLGTSSPRRLFQIKQSLMNYLPHQQHSWTLSTKPLRGNINTRLKKTLAGEVDGLILAAAGLNRVLSLVENNEQVMSLLEQFQWKLLPLSDFTGAPVQGILALEILASRSDLIPYFSSLNCPISEFSYHQEKATLQRFGGGCHLPLGALCWQPPEDLKPYGVPWMITKGDPEVLKLKGKNDSWCAPLSIPCEMTRPGPADPIFLGLEPQRMEQITQAVCPGVAAIADEWLIKAPNMVPKITTEAIGNHERECNILFYLHSRHGLTALKELLRDYPKAQLWVAGAALHRECAKEGLWVMGDSDLLGSDFFETLRSLPLGALLPSKCLGLTSQEQTTKKQQDPLRQIQSYEITKHQMPGDEWWRQLAAVKWFFWTSNAQFQHYYSALLARQLQFHPDSLHSCGPGRTGQKLLQHWQEHGWTKSLIIAPSLACWLQWLYQ